MGQNINDFVQKRVDDSSFVSFGEIEVIDVEQDPGRAFSRVTARPRALLDRSREVLVVWPPELEGPPPPPALTADEPANSDT